MSQTLPRLPSTAAKLQLEIVGGLHSGVSLSLEDGDYTIGSKAESDIVLRDKGVAAQHVVVCVEGSRIRVEAIGGDLQIGDNDILAGHGYRLRLPAVLTIGDASLHLSRDDDQPGIAKRLPETAKMAAKIIAAQRPAVLAAGVLGCAFALTLLVYAFQSSPTNETITQISVTNDSMGPATGVPDEAVAKAQAQLQDKLGAAGIDTIRVTSNGAHITADGRIQASRASEWTAIQRWFDQNFAPKILLAANVVTDQTVMQPAFRVQAVFYGERPYIIESNIRYHEGAIMENGWILQKIGEKGVTLRRGEETLTLTF